jgi:hypothetical protein
MATNRDLLKEAIADAKAVKETAIANAKAALEEAFTPFLKEKLAAKINEMDEADEMDEMEMDEMMYDEAEKMDEMKKKEDMDEMMKSDMDEVSLDELLAELEEEKDEMKEEKDMEETYMEEEITEAEEMEAEEEMSIEDMSEEDLKSFIEDVIKDMVAAGELEAGEEGEEMEGEEIEAEEEEEVDLDELLAEEEEKETLNEIGYDAYLSGPEIAAAIGAIITVVGSAAAASGLIKMPSIFKKFKGVKDLNQAEKIAKDLEKEGELEGKGDSKETEDLKEAYSTIKTLKSELHEINLLNAKLLYTNKIFRNKSLTESQKIKVLTAFDKATSKKEVELVYETLQESLKVSTTKAPIKESLGSASKVLGNASAKPIIEVDNQFARWQQLAGIKK